jgi:hypothetical protein
MPKQNLSVSMPPRIRSLVDPEARRATRSRSAVVNDALRLYFRLRQIGEEKPNLEERAAIVKGERARGDVITLDGWRHAMGFGDDQTR